MAGAANVPGVIKSIAALAPFDGGSGVPRAGGEVVSMKGRVVMDEFTVPLKDTTFSGSGGFGGKIEKEKKESNNVLVTTSMKLSLEKADMPVPRPRAKNATSGADKGDRIALTPSLLTTRSFFCPLAALRTSTWSSRCIMHSNTNNPHSVLISVPVRANNKTFAES